MKQNFRVPAYHTSVSFLTILTDIKKHRITYLDLQMNKN